MAARTRTGCWSPSTSASRRGIGGSTSSSSPTRTRTTSPGWPPCSSATPSGGSSSPGCTGRVPAGRRGTPSWRRRHPARAPRHRRPPAARRGRSDACCGPTAGAVPLEPPDTGTGINNVSIVLLGEVGRPPVPAGRRHRAGHRPDPARSAACPRVDVLKVAHHGSAHGLDGRVPRRRAARGRRGLGRRGQPLRASRAGDARPAAGTRRARLPDRQGRQRGSDRSSEDGSRRRDQRATRRSRSGRRRPRGLAAAVHVRRSRARSGRRGPDPPSTTAGIVATATLATDPDRRPWPTVPPRYHPPHDGPRPRGGGPPAVLAGAAGLVRAARRRCGGGRGVACAPGRASVASPIDRPARRGRRVAARRRQAAPPGTIPSGRCPTATALAAWLSSQGLPELAALVRDHPVTAPRRRRQAAARILGRAARGAARRVRGQARRAAAGADGRPVRLVAATLSAGQRDRLGRAGGPEDSSTCRRPGTRHLRRAGHRAGRCPAPALGRPAIARAASARVA